MRKSTTIGRHAANGQIIFRARRRKGLTQTQLGDAVGVTYRQIIRLENGEHQPSGPVREKLAQVLGIDRTSLGSGDDDEEADMPADLLMAVRQLARVLAGTGA